MKRRSFLKLLGLALPAVALGIPAAQAMLTNDTNTWVDWNAPGGPVAHSRDELLRLHIQYLADQHAAACAAGWSKLCVAP